jgi:hypothetical protein
MKSTKQCLHRTYILVFLVSAAGCGKAASRVDATAGGSDGSRDLPCTGQGCADLFVEVAEDHPASPPDAVLDQADGLRDADCTGQGCVDLPVEVADANPANPADAALDRADDNPANPLDAALDRADGPGDLPALDLADCPASTKIECVDGWLFGGVDGGFCSQDAGVEARCVNGAWTCPNGSIVKSGCTAKQCPDVLPSGPCSSGDKLDCWRWAMPYYQVTCACNAGTWSCLL